MKAAGLATVPDELLYGSIWWDVLAAASYEVCVAVVFFGASDVLLASCRSVKDFPEVSDACAAMGRPSECSDSDCLLLVAGDA